MVCKLNVKMILSSKVVSFYMNEGSVKKAIANRADSYIVDIRRRASSKTKNYLQKGGSVMEKVGQG